MTRPDVVIDMPGAGWSLVRGLGQRLVGLLDRCCLWKDDRRQCVSSLWRFASTVTTEQDSPCDQDDGGESGSQSGESFKNPKAKVTQT
jgi:hypothetical protein